MHLHFTTQRVFFHFRFKTNLTFFLHTLLSLSLNGPEKTSKIQNEIKFKIESTGMRLKPAKCRSFSIRSGVPSKINFTIGETEIPKIF